MKTLVQQLRDAYEKSGWTMDELLDRSRLDLDRSTLRRKLLEDRRQIRHGKRKGKWANPIPMRVEECEALARALDVTLVVVPEEESEAS